MKNEKQKRIRKKITNYLLFLCLTKPIEGKSTKRLLID